MTENTLNIEALIPQTQVGSGQPTPPNKGLDPLFLAYYLLLEAANQRTNSALVHSKLLQGSAIAQQKIDDLEDRIQFNSVPKAQVKYYHPTIGRHSHWNADWTKHDAWHYYTTERANVRVVKNQAQIENVEAQNQRINSQRLMLASKLNVLQQLAQVGETNINTTADEGMQDMSEASNILQILEALTFLALLRQPPR